MNYIFEYIISALATLAFSYYFCCPRHSLFYAANLGGISWTIYSVILNNDLSYVGAAVTSAFTVAILSEYLARKLKGPATIFLLPGIVPLVPGAGMYYTMYYLIQQDYVAFQSKAVETLFMAGSIAAGVVIASSVVKIICYKK